jgi:hypothetical protein
MGDRKINPVNTQRDIDGNSAEGGAIDQAGRRLIATIGIDRYEHWPRLSNAVWDARGAGSLFESLGFTQAAKPLLDDRATGKAIWSLVTDDLTTLGQNDSLVLFYAGHGGTRKHHVGDREIKTGYLIPVDAEDKVSTWVDVEAWLKTVSLLPAKHILVLLDACHSGIALDPVIKWRDIGTWKDTPMSALNARQSRRIITSALDDEVALDSGPVHGHSLFTGCLIEGLTHGIRPADRRTTTGSELGLYVQQRVKAYPRSRQTPDFGTFALDDRGEMVIPLVVAQQDSRARIASTRHEAEPSPSSPPGVADRYSEAEIHERHTPRLPPIAMTSLEQPASQAAAQTHDEEAIGTRAELTAVLPQHREPTETQSVDPGQAAQTTVTAADSRRTLRPPYRRAGVGIAAAAVLTVASVVAYGLLRPGHGDVGQVANAITGSDEGLLRDANVAVAQQHLPDSAPTTSILDSAVPLAPDHARFVMVHNVEIEVSQVSRADYGAYLAQLPGPEREHARPLRDWRDDQSSEPVAWVTFEQARRYCQAIGGKLLTRERWLEASDGSWGIASSGSEPGPLREWSSSTTKEGLALAMGGHARMSKEQKDHAATHPVVKETETSAGSGAAPEQLASATIGIRCAR